MGVAGVLISSPTTMTGMNSELASLGRTPAPFALRGPRVTPGDKRKPCGAWVVRGAPARPAADLVVYAAISYLVIRNVEPRSDRSVCGSKLPKRARMRINAAGDAFFYGLTLGEPISDDLSALHRGRAARLRTRYWSEIEWLERRRAGHSIESALLLPLATEAPRLKFRVRADKFRISECNHYLIREADHPRTA